MMHDAVDTATEDRIVKQDVWSSTSFWQKQALDEDGDVSAPLIGDSRADVCIVGGGFTGLWTALHLKQQAPDLDVVLIEAKRCGDGGSGANAGYALPLWANFPALEEQHGSDEALRLCRASEAVIDEIEDLARSHAADIGMRRHGVIWGATCAAQTGHWEEAIASMDRHQVKHYTPLDHEEIKRRTGSHAYVAGVLEGTSATVHPGKLVRLLRRAVLAAGVRLHETTPMTALGRTTPPVVTTPGGTITADRVVLAMYAWTGAIRELKREIVVLCSDVMVTQPQEQAVAAQGWRDGPALYDSRTLTEGTRTTPDGRVLFNKAGGRLAFCTGVDRSQSRPGRSVDELQAMLTTHMPDLAQAPASHAWSAAIDRTRSGMPLFGRLPGSPHILYGFGYSGRGVLTTNLGGKILASLALDADDAWSHAGFVRKPATSFPPEPIRFLGGLAVRQAIRRKDQLDHAGRKPDPLTSFFYGFKPGRWNRR